MQLVRHESCRRSGFTLRFFVKRQATPPIRANFWFDQTGPTEPNQKISFQ